MKRIVLSLFILVIALTASAEQFTTRPPNNISVNIAGDASLCSLNFEHVFDINEHVFLTGKMGLGYNEEFQLCLFGPCSDPPEKYINLNVHATGNFGKGHHYLEAGFGATLTSGSGGSQYFILYPLLGYRVYPFRTQKIYFRIFGSYPLVGLDNIDLLYAPAGLSVGMSL